MNLDEHPGVNTQAVARRDAEPALDSRRIQLSTRPERCLVTPWTIENHDCCATSIGVPPGSWECYRSSSACYGQILRIYCTAVDFAQHRENDAIRTGARARWHDPLWTPAIPCSLAPSSQPQVCALRSRWLSMLIQLAYWNWDACVFLNTSRQTGGYDTIFF